MKYDRDKNWMYPYWSSCIRTCELYKPTLRTYCQTFFCLYYLIIVKHHQNQNHAELAYILEMPKEPGEAEIELSIEKEASYIVSVINPKKSAASAVPEGGSSYPTEEIPMYPEEILKKFNDSDIFVSLTRDTRLIDYQNAQVILTGVREGKDVIKHDIGIEISDEEETQQSADIFTKLKVRKDQVPIKPLIEGKLE